MTRGLGSHSVNNSDERNGVLDKGSESLANTEPSLIKVGRTYMKDSHHLL